MTIHRKFSDLHFPDSLARTAVLGSGGKPLASHLLHRVDGLEKHLPKCDFLKPGRLRDPGQIEEFTRELHAASHPKIIRACIVPDLNTDHPGDFAASFDLLPTISVSRHDHLMQWIDYIARHCAKLPSNSDETRGNEQLITRFRGDKREAVRTHYQWEGGDPERLLDHVGILVQDDYGPSKGSMVEHPAEKNVFIIEGIKQDFISKPVEQAIYKEDSIFRGKLDPVYEAKVQVLIKLYKAIRDSGKIPDGFSFQLEFGISDKQELKIYQVRLFRKKEEKTWEFMPDEYAHYSSFGQTPEEGIVLPMGYLNPETIDALGDTENAAYYYDNGYGDSNHHKDPDLDLCPENLSLFSFGQDSFLDHGGMRGLAKAPYGIAGDYTAKTIGLYDDSETVKKIRFISDGRSGQIEEIND